MNLPNKLTILRIFLVPVFMVLMIAPVFPDEKEAAMRCVTAAIFILTALTDMLDGRLARKNNQTTDFGKFMDPLADKFMVFGAMLSILYRFDYIRPVFIWAATIVMFRELAVTSVRLVACGNDGIVIAASMLGKIKTVTQIVCVSTILLEPVLFSWFKPFGEYHVLSYITMVAMSVMTLWSGIDYISKYWSHISPNK